MQEKSSDAKSKILVLLNNYSYFQREKITGPKSIIQLFSFLVEQGVSITILLPGKKPISNFPFKTIIQKLNFWNILRNIIKSKIIIVDRHFFILGWVLSKVFCKKLCVRLLGLGVRLQSERLFSKRNLIRILTSISPVDLVISTLDASSPIKNLTFIKSKKVIHRINGVEPNITRQNSNKPFKDLFFFVGRDSQEKGFDEALAFFCNLSLPFKKLDVFGLTKLSQIHKIRDQSKKVFLHGFVDTNQICSMTQDHAFMISGNKLGALGNAELEALARGKKIIYCGDKKYMSSIPENIIKNYVHVSEWRNINIEKFLKQSCKIQNFFIIHKADKRAVLELLDDPF